MASENEIIRDKAWRTAKARMRAERRYRRYDRASHVLICYYSLLLIIAGLFSAELAKLVSHADKVSIALSMTVFALSIVLYGYRFSNIADQHRECYLALQSLYDHPTDQISMKYHEILSKFPNHSPADYVGLLVEHRLNGASLKEVATGAETKASNLQVGAHCMRSLLLLTLFLLALASPWLLVVTLYYIPGQ